MNLKASDLRIGNIVLKDNNGTHTVSWLDLRNDALLRPIILTEHILLKARFKKDSDGCIMLPYCKDYSFYWLDTGFLQIAKGYAPLTNALCKYVHQLQNLIFALTGEELQIKL